MFGSLSLPLSLSLSIFETVYVAQPGLELSLLSAGITSVGHMPSPGPLQHTGLVSHIPVKAASPSTFTMRNG